MNHIIKMIKIIKIILFFFLLNNPSNAEIKIAYFDLDSILSNTNIGKKLFSNLNNSEKLKIQELQKQEQNLKNEENKILSSKNLISEDQLKTDIENFKKKLSEYKVFKEEEISKLKKIRNQEVTNLLNSINLIIETYMNENSISIVIDKKNIYIAKKKYDITNNLIELINKNIK